MSAIGVAKSTFSGWVAPIMRYERHLSALAMVAGFGVDSVTFGRIDRPGAHLIFGSYLALAAITIAAAHALQTRADQRTAALAAAAQALRTSADAGATTIPVPADIVKDGVTGEPVPAASPNAKGRGTSQLSEQAAKLEVPAKVERWRKYLPAATQFALGGLWSGFLVFYSRSASLTASWLFLGTLVAFLVGNEIFRKYHSRLVFAALLLFFAAYSYAVFTVPLVTRTIGKLTFLTSGAIAIVGFLLFLRLLSLLGRKRLSQARWKILGGAAAIAAGMNLFYYAGVLPPLPLALTKIGIFHSVKHTGGNYEATAEATTPFNWLSALGFTAPVMHVTEGEPLSLYSSIFAPVRLTTRITHRWEWYDARTRHWLSQSVVSFPISGGRDRGYRAYTIKSHPRPGDWRVDVETEDGRLIGRLKFTVVESATPVATTNVALN